MSTSPTTPPAVDPDRPIPPRFWWPKRIALACVAWVALLVVARLLWGWEADRRMRAKIAEYHAAGEPILVEDFQRPPIPDEENAAVLYKQAFQRIAAVAPVTVTAPDGRQVSLSLRRLWQSPEWPERYQGEVARLFEANAGALQLARAARDRPQCNWDRLLQFPLISNLPAWLADHRALTQTIGGAASYQQVRGDHAEVVELLRDSLAHVDRMHDPRGALLLHMTLQACEAVVLDGVEQLTPRLAIAGEAAATHVRPTQPAQLRALLSSLLDESSETATWNAAWVGERLTYVDVWACDLDPPSGGAWSTAWGWSAGVTLLRPWWTLKIVDALHRFTQLREAGLASSWPKAFKLAPSLPVAPAAIEELLDPLRVWSTGSHVETHLRLRYQLVAHRRMAATALAIRLYEIDHGRRPATLNELVPTYLPAVPIDPFTSDGAPIRYLPDGTPPRLYSIGQNEVDDGSPIQRHDTGGWRASRDDVTAILESPRKTVATQPASDEAPDDEHDIEQTDQQQQSKQQ